MSCTVPLCAVLNYLNVAKIPMYPYKGLADLHLGFGRSRPYPLGVWFLLPGLAWGFEMAEWLFIGCALVFFLIFGLTEEARRHCISAYTGVARFLHIIASAKDSEAPHG